MNKITTTHRISEERKVYCSIPKFILNNELLQKAIKKCLPENYNFEVYKCIDIILREGYKHIALQLPEGLLIWGLYLSEIFYFFCNCVEEVMILGDVTYGGCCIDDFTSKKLKCDLLIHYGHSCLIPLTVTNIRCIYVFVDIKLNCTHLIETIKKNFDKKDIILLLGTIQFSCVVHNVHSILKNENYFDTLLPIPQVLPLTKGEVLGCTSPNLYHFLHEQVIKKEKEMEGADEGERKNIHEHTYEHECTCSDGREGKTAWGGEGQVSANGVETKCCKTKEIKINANEKDESYIMNACRIFLKQNKVKIVFIADGRFHLESLMIHNPDFSFYRYNPFDKILTVEKYNYKLFYEIRKNEIKKCINCRTVCIILSTLGRQGNVNILKNIIDIIKEKNIYFFILLLSEIYNEKLQLFKNVDVFIQIGCPRLSIDWGNFNMKPLLNTYEAYVLFKSLRYRKVYPMDYYSSSGNEWTNYNAGIGNVKERNLSMKEIIKRRIQMRKNKINIHYQ
ncbi:diphthamide biosynthesis protein 1 [Plasmodium brasilianum]|uniref:2-(3-amino-3-carboxypropyl)histidine synthase subunit 1 n=2 Tax=Plasmodium (Plasmodium) TaxID=418103 RepID=A0A1A8X9U1_PLAMA|nr:diphthamide biosynthesis protein 1, putative [Plasmodium malariae]KAI4835863.1 diphthamide biosynthesis protein 1 [Plasmodium brasilianum]SBT01383.1 diphthamide biosynthesis protein 1, putative (DPH1) [Plasmodium malariae]SCP02799.1 diphthamide biosynthesis protein 1, putative [Plasmodium malariae]